MNNDIDPDELEEFPQPLEIALLSTEDRIQQAADVEAALQSHVFSQEEKNHALVTAASQVNLAAIHALLRHGATLRPVHHTDWLDALQAISAKGSAYHPDVSKIVAVLLAMPDAKDTINALWGHKKSYPPICLAASIGNVDTLKQLVQAGARISPVDNERCFTPLMMAAYGLDTDIVQILLEAGAAPNALDILGRNPFHYLAQHENYRDKVSGGA